MKIIAFDVDGTIVDSLDSIIYFVNETLHKNGFYRINDRKYYEKIMGYGSKYLIKQAMIYPWNHVYDDQLADKLLVDYMEMYSNNASYLSKAYDGIIDMLKELIEEGYILVAYSNKPDKILQGLMKDIFEEDLFDYIIGKTDEFPSKPDSSALENIIEKYNISKEEIVYVGDTEVDIETAKNTGVKSIVCTWGFRRKEFLKEKNPDFIVDTVDELKQVLKNL